MLNQCPRCGAGFVAREPFVRVDTLVGVPSETSTSRRQVGSADFHLGCAPWGDPKIPHHSSSGLAARRGRDSAAAR